MYRVACLAVASLCLPQIVTAQGPHQPRATAPAALSGVVTARSDSIEFARLTQPEDLLLKLADRAMRAGLEVGLAQNPDLVALGKAHPGLMAALTEEVAKTADAHFRANLPQYYNRYALFYQARFTRSEIAEIGKFLRTAAGRKMVAAKMGNFDLGAMVDQIGSAPDSDVTAPQMLEANGQRRSRRLEQ